MSHHRNRGHLWILSLLLYLTAIAAQLCLTEPLWLGFMRVRPYEFTSSVHIAALLVIALQAIAVWAAAARHGMIRNIKVMFAGLSLLKIALIIGVFGFASIHFTLLVPRWGDDGTSRLLLVRIATVAVLAATNALHLWMIGAQVPRLWTAVSDRWAKRIPLLLSAGVLCVTGLISVFVYEALPHVPDEAAYLFQAECFSNGQIQAEAPLVPEALDIYLVEARDGHWRSVTNPGWPALLAVGVSTGLTAWINPILAAACILLLHRLLTVTGGSTLAHTATLLMATSPWFLFLGASLMTHMLTLFCLLASLVFLTRTNRGWLSLLGAGLCLGWLFTVRPLDGLLAGLLILAGLIGSRRVRAPGVIVFGLGCIATGGFLLLFNHAMLGTLMATPINDYIDRLWYPGANRLGFGEDVGNPVGGWGLLDPFKGHGLKDVLMNLNQNIYNLNFEFLGCGAGSLILMVSHAVWGRWTRIDGRAAIAVFAVAALYSLYWFSGGPDFGARYWFLMMPAILWLSARGVSTLIAKTGGSGRIHGALAVSIIATMIAFIPWRCDTKYDDYRGVTADIREALQNEKIGNAIVLIDDDRSNGPLFRSAFSLNDPNLSPSRPIFMRDLGEASRTKLRLAYPSRKLMRWSDGTFLPFAN